MFFYKNVTSFAGKFEDFGRKILTIFVRKVDNFTDKFDGR